MNRRDFATRTAVAAAGLGLSRLPLSAQAPAQAVPPPVTKFTELRRGVGYFSGNGGTIGYLVNGDGAVAVDSQFMNTAEICVEGLKPRAPKGIAMLINTHHHGDHVGGNKAFRPHVKTIVAQENCLAWHKRVAAQNKNEADQAFADVTFGESWSSSFGGEKIWARYYGPGHTSGDAVITFEQANVVHMGDLLFNRAHPNIDRAAGARAANWIRVLERVTKDASNDTIFIAGHAKDGSVQTARADLLHFRDYLTALLDAARKGAAAGQSREDVQKLAALKGFEDHVAPNARVTLGFVLGLAYDEVTAK